MSNSQLSIQQPSVSVATGRTGTGERRSTARTLVAMVLAALAVRLVTMVFTYPDRLDPYRNHWRFAYEMGMVARSILAGKGFSSPYVGETGPTAWFTPIYPYFLALVFKTFGLFTKASAIAVISVNSLFSALTILPMYAVARRTLGDVVAKWAGWIWVFFPYAIWVASVRIWEYALTTLLLTTLVWLTLLLDEDGSRLRWMLYGLLWGVAALNSPAVLAVLPFLLGWVCWRRHRRAQPWLGRALLAVLTVMLALAPWQVRNYVVLHRVVPLRDNFWVEVRAGNTGDISDIYPDWSLPSTSAAQWNELHRVGEIAYIERKRDTALRFIRENPGLFGWLTWKRIVFTWTGYWSFAPDFASHEPFQIPNIFMCSSLTVLMLAGVLVVWRGRHDWLPPYLCVLGAFPVVYYVTHPGMDYRHPVDPMLVILVASALVAWKERRKSGWSDL